jgi:hypothetical protein
MRNRNIVKPWVVRIFKRRNDYRTLRQANKTTGILCRCIQLNALSLQRYRKSQRARWLSITQKINQNGNVKKQSERQIEAEESRTFKHS